ncbi:MAG: hypothetical protein KHX03_06260 [Clostridium sp.]|nr:hypothetical protein [Clostridium sp.]
MEIKAQLQKPYTESQKTNFIVEYNHNQGFLIEENETALIAKGYTDEESLRQAKQDKYNEANTGARAYLESGEAIFELEEGKHIEATDGNIGKLGAYALSFITGQTLSQDVVFWNTKEDETIALTQEQLAQVLTGLGQVQAEVWNVKFPAYKEQIEACETVQEVKSIVIDYTQTLNKEQTTEKKTSEVI